ncbi:MAG: hypothetical protein HYV14_16765 [Elusimicrobia bacterium]|nr:hypothetical protein [Elusimicrobiota bacterium]
MYEIDGQDRVIPLDLAPPPDPGDPLPIVLAKDGAVILSYVAGRELTVVATFPACAATLFGEPRAKTLAKHPLAERGLKPHGAFEIRDSSWARALEARDGAGRKKHFVFTFRDSVFECVAADIGVELIREDDDTIKLMSKRLYK